MPEMPDDMSRLQEYYFKVAGSCAIYSNVSKKHGAIIVDPETGEILATGYNHRDRSHHKRDLLDDDNEHHSVHAEVDVLRNLKKIYRNKKKNLHMYVVKICNTNQMKFQFSKPCANCADKIIKAGIRKIFYTWNPSSPHAHKVLCN